MKICVGLVRWGARAANPQPDQNYMLYVPRNWARQDCNDLFAGYAGPPGGGARGGLVRVGCMFPADRTVTWEGDTRFDGAACGW